MTEDSMGMVWTLDVGIVSEDEDDVKPIKELLILQKEPIFNLITIELERAISGQLKERACQAILIDYRLPRRALMDVIRQSLMYEAFIPLILLTSQEARELNQQALDAGIDELVLLDQLTSDLLALTIQHQITRKEMERELLQSESRYRRTAELAASVIHNIRNVLGGIEIGCDAILTTVHGSKLPGLHKLAQLLTDNEQRLTGLLESEDRGRLIPKYTRGLGYELQAEQEKIAEEVKELLKQLSSVKDLIDMHQAEAKLGVMLEDIDLENAIQDVLRLTSPDLLRNGVRILRSFDQTAKYVYFNPSILRHILVNIVKNANEAMEQTDGDRQIAFATRPGPKKRVILEISDTGPGIAREYRNRIFLYGYTTKPEGQGLGLHFCRGALRESGGELRVRGNEPGNGATFILIFP